MPRDARRQGSSGIYHIMLRGINRQTIFEDDEDKIRFLETLKKYKDKRKFQLFSYCLMNNHIHLLIKETEEPISESIKRISSSYVYWYNMKYDRCGHLFQERFKSENVDTVEYFLTVVRYIHQNPLKAGLVKDVFESNWTSINEYIHKGNFVDIEYGLSLFSQDRELAVKNFKKYMQQSNHDQCLEDRRRIRLADSDVMRYLHHMGVANISEMQQMERDKRDAVLLKLKQLNGVSLRQLSRITGISKSVIHRIH